MAVFSLCSSTNKICPPITETQGWRVCPGDICQTDLPPGSGVSRTSRNYPWAALPNSASGPAAENWIWVQWSRGVVKAAGDAGLAGLWTPDDHLFLDPACSGQTTPAGNRQSISFQSCCWCLWLSTNWPGITHRQFCADHGWVLCWLKWLQSMGNNYWKPTITPLFVMAELMIQIMSSSAPLGIKSLLCVDEQTPHWTFLLLSLVFLNSKAMNSKL